MATRRKDPDPAAGLKEASAAREELLDRIAAGADVRPEELVEADAAVNLARLRVEAAETAAAREVEESRQARIAAIVGSVTDGHLEAQADGLVCLWDEAVAVLGRLQAAAQAYGQEIRAAAGELGRLDPTSLTRPGAPRATDPGFRIDRSYKQLTVGSRRLRYDDDFPVELIAEAAAAVVSAATLGAAVQKTPVRNGSTIGRLRRAVRRPDAAEDGGLDGE